MGVGVWLSTVLQENLLQGSSAQFKTRKCTQQATMNKHIVQCFTVPDWVIMFIILVKPVQLFLYRPVYVESVCKKTTTTTSKPESIVLLALGLMFSQWD